MLNMPSQSPVQSAESRPSTCPSKTMAAPPLTRSVLPCPLRQTGAPARQYPHRRTCRCSVVFHPSPPPLVLLPDSSESLADDDALAHQDLRHARRLDRKVQRAALEELAPRADPGTRERQLEKRAAVNETMRGFREKSPGVEVAEADLLGDDADALKKQKGAWERKKNERELRKEEALRVCILCLGVERRGLRLMFAQARAEEREERLAEHRAREEKVMEGLRALARQNFGGGRGE